MFLALAVLLAVEVVGSPLANSPPDVKDFNVVLSKELEFRIDDCKTGFVGRVIVYQNPDDQNEFVRAYYRQVAIVSERACKNNTADADGSNVNLSNFNYHKKDETETLGRVQKATDAFAYVQWRTIRDSRTGQDIRDGYFRSWLLEQNGNWTFGYGYNLETSPFSEPSKEYSGKRIVVGIKFSLAGAVHIVRIDQDDIPALAKPPNNIQDKEETNEEK
ncbi:MAG: hypothetical protein A3G51_03530 [Candidatus Yanofskybacteria bacterium RIFCSPLOWO2_12_FULL_43_11b]|uniref:Uncharacterized protein n=2 Tax=Parcubacteria group TaxID=1794811 RepID=A0A1G2RPQ6_9BACT|nr:MAG: hypothetical protein A2742_02190 [Candidatus Yanofskybacteria bacterium RIFCSPHIGHO2_01_FULL_43_32]OGN11812.1 MAG: hypothetical protein A3C69_00425 [Candidatus Yanofskybacteria bacterium RIFCSPHIGHO2_02_FULL_43_12]OGN34429.1 MAG: hypothetical protein A3G51_03530 [Candidatus Yanofskybacteria bacterium RIFCSPLOWO2_12_FULL_43_11b]OHA74855.1 MAG: hypothetical protein A3A32_03330 [Candidatus Wildermuthbacteria bacterium RIFCSPLOWO2_01_FULL_48_35]